MRIVDVSRALECEMVEGRPDAEVCLLAKGYQDPDLRTDLAKTSGRVCFSRAISLRVPEKWQPWNVDVKHAFLRPDGFERVVYHPARGCAGLEIAGSCLLSKWRAGGVP